MDIDTIENAINGIVIPSAGWCMIGGPDRYKPKNPGAGVYIIAMPGQLDGSREFYIGSGTYFDRIYSHIKEKADGNWMLFKPIAEHRHDLLPQRFRTPRPAHRTRVASAPALRRRNSSTSVLVLARLSPSPRT
jgi:hypothetical protein